eukprot:NODE_184_length_15718_cov_0.161342.p13 type:complete len:113 gc:universal NODE_184_length_15718_cov_0.161342:5679-5341(-)
MSSSMDFELSQKIFNMAGKQEKRFNVEKKSTMRNALLQMIKQQESQVELIKRDYENELHDVQQNMDMLLAKISEHDEQVVLKIQQLYGNIQKYHHLRKQLLHDLVADMGLKK